MKPILYKSLFQIRLRPELRFQPTIFTSLGKMEEGYGDWMSDGNTTILSNYEERRSLMLRLDAVQHDQDSSSATTEQKGIADAVSVVREHFRATKLQRIGLKRSYLIELEDAMNLPSLVALLNVKLYAQEKAIKECLPGTLKDLLYRVDTTEGFRGCNVLVGPVKREEVPRYIQFNANAHTKQENRNFEVLKVLSDYPKLSLLCDVDYFQGDPVPAVKDIDEFVDKAMKRTNDVCRGIATFLFE